MQRFPIPPEVIGTLRPGHVIWFDTRAGDDGPVERRFLCATQTDIDRGWIDVERLRVLAPGDVGMTSDADDVRSLTGQMGPAPVADSVAFSPAHKGEVGCFWQCNLAEIRKSLLNGKADGTVGIWIVEAPWAHPVWHSYVVVLVHLRPFPGMVGGTRVYLEGATHELWVYALQPDTAREPAIRGRANPLASIMNPKQFAAQFIEPSDGAATERVEAALKEVCSGHLSPDSGHHHQLEWAVRFGGNMLKPLGAKATYVPGEDGR